MNVPVPAVDPGLIWYQVPEREEVGERFPSQWVRAYTDGKRLWRLTPVGEGLPLADCPGSIMGPLPQPKGP